MGLLDFLFGAENKQALNWLDAGHNYSHQSGNWTDADDWQCGEKDDHDGMFGFDGYEENDF